jgi:hypothetical protein
MNCLLVVPVEDPDDTLITHVPEPQGSKNQIRQRNSVVNRE